MESLPAWARKKILDGFVRRWTRSRVTAGGFPLSVDEEIAEASQLLTAGNIRRFEHHDLASVVEQLVLLQMDHLEEKPDAWRRLLSDMPGWTDSEALPAQAVAYAHLAAAEEYLDQGDSMSALVLIESAPPGPHVFGALEGSVSWPQVHHVRALAKLLSGEPDEAGRLTQLAIDEALRVLPSKDIQYLKDLQALRAGMAALVGGEAETTKEQSEDSGVELVLFVGRAKTGSTGHWQLGSKRSGARFNSIEVRTARVFVTHLRAALSKRRDITVSKLKLDKSVLDSLDENRHESHLRKVRRGVLDALTALVGTGVATVKVGSKGGIIFHGELLHSAGIVKVRTKNS